MFVGDNAQGKTNIIESIYMSAFGKSYRTQKDNEVVKFGDEFCIINLNYNKNNIDNEIQVYVDNLNRKQIKLNDLKVKKIMDFVGEIPIVIFSPDSLDIVKGAPGKRRRFLDMVCSQLSKSYLLNLQEYNKCLKLKNSILKKDYIDEEYIKVLHMKMAKYIEKIVLFRKDVILKLEQKGRVIEKSITGGKEELCLNYLTDFINLSEMEILELLNSHLYIDKMRKSSIKGIQRDDIEVLVNEKEVSKFGSQGQNRTSLLVLKLANFEVLIDELGENPILLLDDIMSELDRNRINFLLEYIGGYQSIITTTDSDFLDNINNIKISKVFNGTLEI